MTLAIKRGRFIQEKVDCRIHVAKFDTTNQSVFKNVYWFHWSHTYKRINIYKYILHDIIILVKWHPSEDYVSSHLIKWRLIEAATLCWLHMVWAEVLQGRISERLLHLFPLQADIWCTSCSILPDDSVTLLICKTCFVKIQRSFCFAQFL